MAELVFWTGFVAAVYTYIGYPILLVLFRSVLGRPVIKSPVEPSVSLLVPAYNEAANIRKKIENCLALDYPAEKLEVIVACDGSTDDTAALARETGDGHRVQVLSFPRNRGKIPVLNDTAGAARGEIVVFSDASATLRPDAVRRLVANFADPEVGAVSGRYTLIKTDEVSIGSSEGIYWRYETFLKTCESRIHSALGAHGHLHAIRRELYPFPPAGTINDDYVIPVSVIGRGYRAVYEPAAVVCEEAREMTGFGRRIRIMAGNFQQIGLMTTLLRPVRPLPLLFFFSHKIMRLLVPVGLLAMMAANLTLYSRPLYLLLCLGQATFYGLALLGAAWRLRPPLLLLPYYFCMINAAAFFGVYHALTRRRKLAWK